MNAAYSIVYGHQTCGNKSAAEREAAQVYSDAAFQIAGQRTVQTLTWYNASVVDTMESLPE
jgi:hypothetical protein